VRPRVVCTIEARMTSSRLPGKVLLPVLGRPLLEHMVERLRRSRRIDAIVLATTAEAASDPLEALAAELGIGCFRGSEDDVLARVLGAAQASGADIIVETTGDCPLIDPTWLDVVVDAYLGDGGCDFCSNTLTETFPRGTDVRVFSTEALAEVAQATQDPADREHVSLYFWTHPERYHLREVRSPDPTLGSLRLTVDTPEDLALVRAVFERLYPQSPAFGLDEIATLLREHPEIRALNASIQQKAV
jgi:spore coat polysaccharide biosynthesis protein SpsF